MLAGLEFVELGYLCAVIGVGAFVRGFTGFGSSMIYVVGLTFAMPASQAVPVILMLEVVTTAGLLPSVWRQVEWRSVAVLLLGCIVATPVGLWILSYLAPAPMQAVIACVVLGVCVMLRSGFRLKRQPGVAGTLGVGLISGVLTGTTSTGGPPVVLYYYSGPLAVGVARASIIVFLGLADLFATGMASYQGIIDGQTVTRAALAVLPMIVGTGLGALAFKRADPDKFRRWVILVLAVLSVVSLGKAVLAMVA